MNRELQILIIDDSEHEARLAASALALHAPRLNVKTAGNVRAALQLVQDAGLPRLVILGRKCLEEAAALRPLLCDAALPVVAFAADAGPSLRDSAAAAGVDAVYDRPLGWEDYRDAIAGVLDRWLIRPDLGA